MPKLFTLVLLCTSFLLTAQNPNKKQLDHEDFDVWKAISEPQISNDGQWATYALTVERGDPIFFINHIESGKEYFFERGKGGKISADNKSVIFKIHTPVDSVRAMKRRKIKAKDMPADTLVIFDLKSRKATRIPDVKSFKIPEKWAGWLVYNAKALKPEPKDSTEKKSKEKPEDFVVIKNLSNDFELKIPSGKSFTFAEEGRKILIASESKDSTFDQGVYIFDCNRSEVKPLLKAKGVFKFLKFDKAGKQAAFLADLDTTKTKIRPFNLYFWNDQKDQADLLDPIAQKGMNKDWMVSEFGTLRFSENGSRLFFGVAPPPILEDTTLLDEDKVNVEVWSWNDARLYTQQEVQLTNDKEFSFPCVYDIPKNKFLQLGDETVRELRYDRDRNARYAIGVAKEPYLKTASWEGFPEYRDMYFVDLQNGVKKKFAHRIKGFPNVSPKGKFFYWFNAVDTTWQTYNTADQQIITVTNNRNTAFYDELNDRPMLPSSNGMLGWSKDDQKILIYDRYDVWSIDPMGKTPAKRLTDGRANNLRYRYIRTNPEEQFIDPEQTLLFSIFDEKTKQAGYATMRLNDSKAKLIMLDDFQYSRPRKAKDADRFLWTKQNFQVFPNLLVSDEQFKNPKRISDANPQQSLYSWGTIELYEWTSADGQKLQGLLTKPENFDQNKKYPMIVNFYERSSNRLNRHRAPYPGRSTINYSFYTSRGYVIFNPDVPYTVGYPGESAEKAVLSGTMSLIDEGFIDKDRIGVQGHSWGGYQIAHLITRSNIFRCAESGAPVVNMFSAYGGIRWGSGLSRMFQYENTQSRIGGTIWDYPVRYMENSPIFYLDKVDTPVLILHNDKDGAVPWYQGIEFFVSLRRLGKPAWLLNYNGEPHWPVKRQNRLDFNVRMQQFFDYYLMDAKMPVWMERGVPAVEKGIRQGLELRE